MAIGAGARRRLRPAQLLIQWIAVVSAIADNRLKTRGKGILLLHDIHPATVVALPGLLKELRQRDFHVVHVVPISIDQF